MRPLGGPIGVHRTNVHQDIPRPRRYRPSGAMRIFDESRSGLTPAAEQLLEGFDASSPEPLTSRELRVELVTTALFLVAAVLMATLVVVYAATSRVRFVVRWGFTVPTQLVFVPMLFLLPAGAAPLFVAAGIVLGGLPDCVRGQAHPSRLLMGPGDAWHSVGPALVIALAGSPEPSLSQWALLLGAFGAQLLLDNVVSSLREWLGQGIPPSVEVIPLGWVVLVDLLLSPIGLLAAVAAAVQTYSVLLVLPLAALLAIFAAERQARLRQALELSRAYRGTTLLLADVLEADDEYTGVHSHGVVALSVAVADAMGLDSRERRNVEFGALLHDIGKIAVPKEIIHKPGPLTDDEWLASL